MPRQIAFLRAINVGGHNVRMEDLRRHLLALGLTGVETFIASGNVIFDRDERPAAELEQAIAHHLQQTLGYEVATFVRSDAEVAAIASHPAFEVEKTGSGPLAVCLLAQPMSPAQQATLLGMRNEHDDFHIHGREVYWLRRQQASESVFSNMLFEKTLKLKTTLRGINTLQKLAAKYPAA
ncbi:DUF1697 domain-containing protein [Chitinimonas prasina]|nr:DUF1697 domain-containing protein [Chitinimonas prasina]